MLGSTFAALKRLFIDLSHAFLNIFFGERRLCELTMKQIRFSTCLASLKRIKLTPIKKNSEGVYVWLTVKTLEPVKAHQFYQDHVIIGS